MKKLLFLVAIATVFIFFPYTTKYYQCKYSYGIRSLTIKKYLPNNYSMVISGVELRPHIIKKEWCQSNSDSEGFACKFKVPKDEDINKLLDARKKALALKDEKSVRELDEYIKTLPYEKYLYRFDPITNLLKEVINLSDGVEISDKIYRCEPV